MASKALDLIGGFLRMEFLVIGSEPKWHSAHVRFSR